MRSEKKLFFWRMRVLRDLSFIYLFIFLLAGGCGDSILFLSLSRALRCEGDSCSATDMAGKRERERESSSNRCIHLSIHICAHFFFFLLFILSVDLRMYILKFLFAFGTRAKRSGFRCPSPLLLFCVSVFSSIFFLNGARSRLRRRLLVSSRPCPILSRHPPPSSFSALSLAV